MYRIKRFSGKFAEIASNSISDAKILEENGKKISKLGKKGKIGLGVAAVGAGLLGAKALYDNKKKDK